MLGALAGVVLVVLGRRARQDVSVGGVDARLARLLDRASPNTATSMLTLVAGVTLVVGHGGRLYWLVPAVLLAFVSGTANAWLLLVRLPA